LSFYLRNEPILIDIGNMIVGSSYLFHRSAESVTASPRCRRYQCTYYAGAAYQVDTETRPIFNKFEAQARGSRPVLTREQGIEEEDMVGWQSGLQIYFITRAQLDPITEGVTRLSMFLISL